MLYANAQLLCKEKEVEGFQPFLRSDSYFSTGFSTNPVEGRFEAEQLPDSKRDSTTEDFNGNWELGAGEVRTTNLELWALSRPD